MILREKKNAIIKPSATKLFPYFKCIKGGCHGYTFTLYLDHCLFFLIQGFFFNLKKEKFKDILENVLNTGELSYFFFFFIIQPRIISPTKKKKKSFISYPFHNSVWIS
ncbi:uncharacterized protein EV154DRAFT_495667 [Mucor mucedo]|uniref:uncharacterized protein n=1 Tax=Mucor mucedo TaxID=29922 RepID=UPI00221F1A3B|nr:uncharacterized protein EV154DRAFT_495667 [Mucor mucedo]KAI7895342.1 hypothetical protein EV154DRAFT_495667 [Mucor mucedo]